MKNKNNFCLNLLIFIGAPVLSIIGILIAVLSGGKENIILGCIPIGFAAIFCVANLSRIVSARKERKEHARKTLLENQAHEKKLNAALQAFLSKSDCPETNTLKIIGAGMEFFAEGRYACKKDFKGISGNHLAFEITSCGLKHKPDDYDDVCDIESSGVFVAVGYFDGKALETESNDSGVVLQDPLENSIGRTFTITSDNGYVAHVWTAEGDEIDYGFVKIIKYENDVLTVRFSLNVPVGLCDTVEGVVELQKDTGKPPLDISSLIRRIKHKPYNTVELSGDEVRAIAQSHPFLPDGYITFLSKVGFADLDWIDLGRNANTATNLFSDETEYVNAALSKLDGNKTADDFYFIAVDNNGTYYAFSENSNDKKVYVISDNSTNGESYETFEDFLNEILNV